MIKRFRIWGADVNSNGAPHPKLIRLHGFCENGMPWTHTAVRIIELIEERGLDFYYLAGGKEIKIEVATDPDGRKFLKGRGDTNAANLVESLDKNKVVFKVEG